MMFRNLMAMDVEEMVRAQPMDAVVLVGGCDKTVPAQLMGALSPAPGVQLVTGPMLTGRHGGAPRRLHRLPAILGELPGGEDAARDRDVERTGDHGRDLRGDGHGEHDGVPEEALGMALPGAPPRRPCTPPACAPPRRPAAPPCGGRRASPDQIVTPQAIRERAPRAPRDRRFDQRAPAPHGHRRPLGFPSIRTS